MRARSLSVLSRFIGPLMLQTIEAAAPGDAQRIKGSWQQLPPRSLHETMHSKQLHAAKHKTENERCTLPQSSSVQRSERHCTCHHDLRVALVHDSRHVLATTKLGVAIKEATREHARYLIVTWNGDAYDFAAALALVFEANRR